MQDHIQNVGAGPPLYPTIEIEEANYVADYCSELTPVTITSITNEGFRLKEISFRIISVEPTIDFSAQNSLL